jgi:hypothetical protein
VVKANCSLIAQWLCVLGRPEELLKIVLPSIHGFSIGSLVILEQFAKHISAVKGLDKMVKALHKACPSLGLTI